MPDDHDPVRHSTQAQAGSHGLNDVPQEARESSQTLFDSSSKLKLLGASHEKHYLSCSARNAIAFPPLVYYSLALKRKATRIFSTAGPSKI